MTTIYFIRHNKHDFEIQDESRPLTNEGQQAANEITIRLQHEPIEYFFSSPYERAIQTIQPLTIKKELPITLFSDFRERAISDTWIEDFTVFTKQQCHDFSYKFENGECLQEVQERNMLTLHQLLTQ